MATGTVSSFNPKTGWGFIKPDDGSDNVFVYQGDIDMDGFRCLYIGEKVEYDAETSDRGIKAKGVIVTEESDLRHSNEHRNSRNEEQLINPRDFYRVVAENNRLRKQFNTLIEILSDSNQDVDPILTSQDIIKIKQ